MVEIFEGSIIRVRSSVNGWIDAVFLVNKEDEEKAKAVLEEAWDWFLEDEEGWGYGDCLEVKLVAAGITFEAYYSDAN